MIIKNIFMAAIFILSLASLGSLYPGSETPALETGNFLQNASAQKKDAEVGLPIRLIIPDIGVDAAVQYKGLAQDGSIGAPDGAYDVSWFNAGPRPGEKGSAVMTGHYGQWASGTGSVFDNLSKLRKGGQILVMDDKENLISFTVQDIKVYAKNDSVPEIFGPDDAPYLNLITCNGSWLKDQKTFAQRLIVFTKITEI